jgi:hypothetical protein
MSISSRMRLPTLATAALLVLASTHASECHCSPDHQFVDFGCSDTTSASGGAIVLQDGECVGSGCTVKSCKWLTWITITVSPAQDIVTYVNAVPRHTAFGASKVEVNNVDLSASCNSNADLALGYGGNICAELILECGECGS